jgi:hypothetical protein
MDLCVDLVMGEGVGKWLSRLAEKALGRWLREKPGYFLTGKRKKGC